MVRQVHDRSHACLCQSVSLLHLITLASVNDYLPLIALTLAFVIYNYMLASVNHYVPLPLLPNTRSRLVDNFLFSDTPVLGDWLDAHFKAEHRASTTPVRNDIDVFTCTQQHIFHHTTHHNTPYSFQ
jgi:hypothetical protein